MRVQTLASLVSLLGCLALALADPSKPTEDNFYTIPDDIADYNLGDIINWRVVPLEINAVVVALPVKNAWQFLVRSTDQHGEATAIVTTVLEPHDADPLKVLSYQFAEDSPLQNCAPSYSMLTGMQMATLEIQMELYYLQVGLARGWYVVAPDHEGFTGGFTVGRQSGQATLDSIRAVLQSEAITGVLPDAKVAMWGYSGGTVPSAWAAQLQPSYAPALSDNLVGVATGGLVTNISLTAVAADGTAFAGLIPLAVKAIFQVYPEALAEFEKDVASDEKYARFMEAADMCTVPALTTYAFQTFFGGDDPTFSNGLGFLRTATVQAVVEENALALDEGDGVPEIPFFVYHALDDEVVPYSGAERAYENYCSWGIASMEFAVSKTGGHAYQQMEGAGAAVKWLSDRLDGVDAVSGCKRTERALNLEYPSAATGFYWLAKTALDDVRGVGLGEDVSDDLPDSAQGLYQIFVDIMEALASVGGVNLRRM